MLRSTFRSSLVLAVAATLTACQAYPAGPLAPAPGVRAPEAQGPQARRPLLQGRVQWSDLRRLLATAAEVGTSATVTLIDAEGTPVAAGLADADGDFAIYDSLTAFEPADGDAFTLEVTRRTAGDASRTLLSLRTVVRYVDGTTPGYTSITGETIVVSAMTTAIAQLAEDADFPAGDVIGALTGDVVSAFGDYDAATAQALADARLAQIEAKLLENVDPNQLGGDAVDGDVTLASAADMRTLARTRVITGNLRIAYEGSLPLTLPMLEEVGGTVTVEKVVEDGVGATGLPGLSKLASVGEGLLVYADTLTSLAGLEALTEVGGGVSIDGCAELASLDGLEGLEAVGGNLVIATCPKIGSLVGLDALGEVGGDVRLSGLKPTLSSLAGLGSLETIGGELRLTGLAGLTGLAALDDLVDVGGLNLEDLDALTSLAGLAGATFAEDASIALVGLPLLGSLDGLAGVAGEVALLQVHDCTAFDDLAGLGAVTHVGTLSLAGTSLTTLAGLSAGALTADTFSLADPAAGCAGPTGLGSADMLHVNEAFTLSGLPALASLAGPGFEPALIKLRVNDCDALETLASVGTAAITDLLQLEVTNNAALTTLGLPGLAAGHLGGTTGMPIFRVVDNPALPYCLAYELRANYEYVSVAHDAVVSGSADDTCFPGDL